MERTILGNVFNELSLQFKKGEAMTYLKPLCEQYKDKMEEFTSTAMKSAFDYNRSKALDYMLGLPGRHEASMLLKYHIPAMMYSENKFAKGIKIFEVIIKHYPRALVIEEVENAKKYKIKNNGFTKEIEERYKEMMYVVFSKTLPEKNIKTKLVKI